jgi:hypothetical protein
MFRESAPIPHLASPLKGEELDKRVLLGAGRNDGGMEYFS